MCGLKAKEEQTKIFPSGIHSLTEDRRLWKTNKKDGKTHRFFVKHFDPAFDDGIKCYVNQLYHYYYWLWPGVLWLICRYDATDMSLYRSALSACVVRGLPNIQDYIYQPPQRESNSGQSSSTSPPPPLVSNTTITIHPGESEAWWQILFTTAGDKVSDPYWHLLRNIWSTKPPFMSPAALAKSSPDGAILVPREVMAEQLQPSWLVTFAKATLKYHVCEQIVFQFYACQKAKQTNLEHCVYFL